MSSEFLPINMPRRISTEDTSYSKQNQYSNQGKTAKVASGTYILPSNDEISTKVTQALQSIKNNAWPDRGSILNILV